MYVFFCSKYIRNCWHCVVGSPVKHTVGKQDLLFEIDTVTVRVHNAVKKKNKHLTQPHKTPSKMEIGNGLAAVGIIPQ